MPTALGMFRTKTVETDRRFCLPSSSSCEHDPPHPLQESLRAVCTSTFVVPVCCAPACLGHCLLAMWRDRGVRTDTLVTLHVWRSGFRVLPSRLRTNLSRHVEPALEGN